MPRSCGIMLKFFYYYFTIIPPFRTFKLAVLLLAEPSLSFVSLFPLFNPNLFFLVFAAGYGLLVIVCWQPTDPFIPHLTTQTQKDSDRTPAVWPSS